MKAIILLLSLLVCICCAAPDKIFAAWYCGDDACLWAKAPNLANTNWLLNRGDGKPTTNLVIFSFVDPVALLHKTTNSVFTNGIPKGMTTDVVAHFKSKGIGVIFSIGGAEYTPNWDQALREDPVTLAKNAVAVAKQFGVGMEIDYENEGSITALGNFVKTYRSLIPYDKNESWESILCMDVGAGTGYLTSLSKAGTGWISSHDINWMSAMVTASPYGSINEATQYWQQHLDGANWAGIPPQDPHTLIVSLYSSSGSRNCPSYSGTVLESAVSWVNQKKVRGISFWAVGCPAPNNCANNCPGLQQGSKAFLG